MLQDKLKLSIVITTRNRYSDLIACVESIKRSEGVGFSWELIVVDDCSTDETAHLTKDQLGEISCKVIHLPSQHMMVKTRNIGAREAKGEYVLLIDDDNIIDTQMINRLVEYADRNPQVGIFGPSMYNFTGRKKYLDYQLINFYTGKTTGVIDDSKNESNRSDGVPNVFMVRKSVFEKCGYFDEAIVQTYTEPDFAFNARLYGYDCRMVKAAITYHNMKTEKVRTARSMGGGGNFVQKAYFLMRNRSVMVGRYGSSLQKVIYTLFFSWLWPIIYTVYMLREMRLDLIRLYWHGAWDGFLYLVTGELRNSIPRLLKQAAN